MFSPQKHTFATLATAIAAVLSLNVATTHAQNYNTRGNTLRRAQSRAMTGAEFAAPSTPARQPVSQVAHSMPSADGTPIRTSKPNTRFYVPKHLRVAQQQETPAVEGGAPINTAPTPVVSGEYVDDSYYNEGFLEESSGCDSCGVPGRFFDSCDSCSGRGGCPPGTMENCWLWGMNGLFRNSEFSIGAHGFRAPQFQVTDVNGATQTIQDASFGFYAGFNTGVPLCRLTCGLLSGQIGVRASNSEFTGNPFSADNRGQLFFTAGVYRRVDHGWQFGIVADILHEEWFTETDLVQLRGDLAWMYPTGDSIGFRFTHGTQTDITQGIIEDANGNNVAFNGLNNEVIDNYRFYYRNVTPWGGFSEATIGWSDESHFVMSLDFDVPICETTAMQAGVTYFLPEDEVQRSQFGGNANDAWNLYLGFVFRPKGRSWYKSYDRPLFNIADNGTMVIRRR